MIPVSIDFVNEKVLKGKLRTEIDKYVETKNQGLKDWLNEKDEHGNPVLNDQIHRDYLEALTEGEGLKRIVYAEPDQIISTYLEKFNGLAPKLVKLKKEEIENRGLDYKNYKNSQKPHLEFKDALVDSYLNYDLFRKKFLRRYFHKMGIKACVYCNANFALTLEKENESFKAKYQVDHYWPKAIFPCFSISLFNFIPSCAACNHAKTDHLVHYTMYTRDQDRLKKSLFHFDFPAGAVPKDLLFPTQNELKIEVSIEHENKPTLNIDGVNWQEYDEVFDITGIYNMMTDIAEEICRRKRIYSKGYRETLKKSFPKVFNDKNLSDRIILGNYSTDEEIHNRPLAKYMQDIARRVGLIDGSSTSRT